MRIAKTYSHFHGLEFLEVHRPELLHDLRQSIEELEPAEIENGDGDIFATTASNGAGARRYHVKLDARDWHYLNSARLPCFNKQQTGLKFCFGLRTGELKPEFDDFCARYRNGEIELGVGVFPMERIRQDFATVDFETAVQDLRKRGRVDTVVPLLLFAVEA